MRFALDMCAALDMPCGANGVISYRTVKRYIEFADRQIYRILQSKIYGQKEKNYGFLQSAHWVRYGFGSE